MKKGYKLKSEEKKSTAGKTKNAKHDNKMYGIINRFNRYIKNNRPEYYKNLNPGYCLDKDGDFEKPNSIVYYDHESGTEGIMYLSLKTMMETIINKYEKVEIDND